MGVPCTSNRAPAPQHRGHHGLGGQLAFRRRDCGAWGETLPGGFDNVPGGMPYSFVGALGVRTDVDTGLLYMRQRWYDPTTLQRFISRDPIGLAGGANLYAYANGNPSNWSDAFGLDPAGSTGSPRIPTGGGGDSIRRTPNPGSKPVNLTPSPAQMLLWLLMKAYGDARANLPAPGQGPSGPIPLPSPGPTPTDLPNSHQRNRPSPVPRIKSHIERQRTPPPEKSCDELYDDCMDEVLRCLPLAWSDFTERSKQCEDEFLECVIKRLRGHFGG